MEIKKITDLIENFAPLELQEAWDNCGFQVYGGGDKVGRHCYADNEKNGGMAIPPYVREIKKILLCVSVTQDIINQAVEGNFDMIISHHPLFFIPFGFNKNIPIYSAHTNLDKADGGTTDTLIEVLSSGLHSKEKQPNDGGLVNPPYFDDSSPALNASYYTAQKVGDFLRLVELQEEILLDNFVNLIKNKLNILNLRVVNNLHKIKLGKIAFCAGSGADFLGEAEEIGADAIVTGDVKYHQALESNVIIIDVGHFESERPVLKTIKKILEPLKLEVMEADEKSPFINY